MSHDSEESHQNFIKVKNCHCTWGLDFERTAVFNDTFFWKDKTMGSALVEV